MRCAISDVWYEIYNMNSEVWNMQSDMRCELWNISSAICLQRYEIRTTEFVFRHAKGTWQYTIWIDAYLEFTLLEFSTSEHGFGTWRCTYWDPTMWDRTMWGPTMWKLIVGDPTMWDPTLWNLTRAALRICNPNAHFLIPSMWGSYNAGSESFNVEPYNVKTYKSRATDLGSEPAPTCSADLWESYNEGSKNVDATMWDPTVWDPTWARLWIWDLKPNPFALWKPKQTRWGTF